MPQLDIFLSVGVNSSFLIYIVGFLMLYKLTSDRVCLNISMNGLIFMHTNVLTTILTMYMFIIISVISVRIFHCAGIPESTLLWIITSELCSMALDSGMFKEDKYIYYEIVEIERTIALYEIVPKQSYNFKTLPPEARMLLAEARRQFAIVKNAYDGKYALAYMLDKSVKQFANCSDVEYITFIRTIIAKLCT